MEQSLREKEEELEIYKSGMDQTLLELNELRMVCYWNTCYWTSLTESEWRRHGQGP